MEKKVTVHQYPSSVAKVNPTCAGKRKAGAPNGRRCPESKRGTGPSPFNVNYDI